MKALLLIGLFLQIAPSQASNGTITGQVALAGDLPAAGIRIAVVAVPVTASGSAAPAILAAVDNAGNFRLENLSPGSYYIRAGLADATLKDAPTYYPGVTALAEARPISVSPGAFNIDVKFALAGVPGVRVSGRIIGQPTGTPPGMVRVTLARGTPPMGSFGLSDEVPVSADGSFEFRHVVPGSYFFRISPSTIPPTTTPIIVADTNLDSIALPVGHALLGHVVLEGGSLPVPTYSSPQEPSFSTLKVMANNQQILVRSDGSFLWVPAAGEYKMDMTALPFNFNIKAMSYGTVDLLQTPLRITGTSVASPDEILITLTAAPNSRPAGVRVSGRVGGPTGDPAAVRSITIERTWTRETVPPWNDRRRQESALGPDGMFEFLHVPRGPYFLTINSNRATIAMAAIVVADMDITGINVSNSSPVAGLPAQLQTELEFRRTILEPRAGPTPPVLSQASIQIPKRFEIYYETGVVGSRVFDSFDSEKKERVYDAQGGQVLYRVEMTPDDASRIFQAIQQNNIIPARKDFTDMGNIAVDPAGYGLLRINVDGQVSEFRFRKAYGTAHRDDAEWARFQNVYAFIESILKEKDQQQTLPRHNVYL